MKISSLKKLKYITLSLLLSVSFSQYLIDEHTSRRKVVDIESLNSPNTETIYKGVKSIIIRMSLFEKSFDKIEKTEIFKKEIDVNENGRLVRIKDFGVYDEESLNNLRRLTKYKVEKFDITTQLKTLKRLQVYKYNDKDRRTEYDSYDIEGNLSQRDKYIYDSSNRLIEYSRYSGDGKLSESINYEYDNDGKIVSQKFSNSKNMFNRKNIYNQNGQLILSNTTVDFDEEILMFDTFLYDENGNKVEQLNKTPSTNKERYSWWSYDSKNRVIESQDGIRQKFKYDSNDRLIEWTANNIDKKEHKKVKITYKKNSQLPIEEKLYHIEQKFGEFIETLKYSYSYEYKY